MDTHTLRQSIHRSQRNALSAVVLVAFAIPALTHSAQAQNAVTVAWDANPETDIAGYKLYLGTVSGLYSQIQDVGNQTTVELPGLTHTVTYYCTVQAYNWAGLVSELSSEISFATQSPAVLINTWATVNGLSGSDADPAATPFNDGVANLLKFAFNLNATGPDSRVLVKGTGTAGLPVFALTHAGSSSWFTIEFLRRKTSGLIYTPKTSTDLQTYVPMIETPTVTAIDGEWERVVIQKPSNLATTPRLFGLVEVTLP